MRNLGFRRGWLAASLITLFLLPCALGQTRDSATVSGRVSDASGARLAGAHVEITNLATGLTRNATSDENGDYTITGLPIAGSWVIRVEKFEYASATVSQLQLRAGTLARVDVALRPQGRAEHIDVTGTTNTVRSDTAEIGSTLGLQQIENTPVLSRRLTTLPLLDSSVRPARGTGDLFLNNTLWVVNGAGRRQTTFAVDNSTGDDSWGRQTLFTTIPFAAVEEFTVLTNSLSAEYGRNAGGAVNIVTKSGSNDLHGQVLGLWRPGGIQARPPLATTATEDVLGQGSGTVSGPLQRDRTFFLVSGEYTRQSRDSVITSPFDPGLYTGHFHQGLFFTRIDHKLNDRNWLFARLNFDRFSDSNPQDAVGGTNLPSTARVFSRRTYSAQISETMTLDRFVNEARFQYQLGSPITQFQPVTPSTQFVYAGVATIGDSRYADLLNHQYQWADTMMFTRGKHIIKTGADVIYSRSGGYGQEFGGGYTLGQFRVKSGVTVPVSQLTINDVSQYTQSFGNLNYEVDESIVGGFVQDDWTVRHDLTLNLGMRYEVQTYSDDRNNVAPRVGFAYTLPTSHPMVLRGSYGVFYSELRADLGANFELNGPQGILGFTVAPGQVGFPTSLAPLPAFPAGATLPARDVQVRPGDAAYLSQFFNLSQLPYYPSALLNPYTQQWSLGTETELGRGWILSLDYLGQHTIGIDRPIDLNAPAPFLRTAPGQTRSAAVADATRPITPLPNGFRRIIATVNDGSAYYNGLQVQVKKHLSTHMLVDASYTWSHNIDTVDPDVPSQDPNEQSQLGLAERASSVLDQRHRLVLSGSYFLPWRFTVGTVTSLASGRPYNITTGTDNNGDGSTSDRPVIDGQVIGRNAGQGAPTYDVSTFMEKSVALGDRFQVYFRGEVFNLFNHNNIVGWNGVYGNLASGAPLPTFGQPLGGISNTEPGREFQFLVRLAF